MDAHEHAARQKVVGVAREIANRAPRRKGTYVSDALIPWTLIDELREALADAGIEWE